MSFVLRRSHRLCPALNYDPAMVKEVVRLVVAINVRRSKVRVRRNEREREREGEREKMHAGERKKEGDGMTKKSGIKLKREETRYFYVFYIQRVWFHRSVAAKMREYPGGSAGARRRVR